nr:RNA-directed DNA polymerase, eukaryota, reverse transcriptase zinc-binding domain protein [Tanacetum cinerariifolium]
MWKYADIMIMCSAVTLDRYLSDHRPILLRESMHDYGPIPFRFFHYWVDTEGFDKFIRNSWNVAPVDGTNALRSMMGKLKFLKVKVREWNSRKRNNTEDTNARLNVELQELDEEIDKGNGSDESVIKRMGIINSLKDAHRIQAAEVSQKAKVKWSVEWDGNVRFFHGLLNKKRSQMNNRGIMIDGIWTKDPHSVKWEFFQHFRNRFDKPKVGHAHIDMCYLKTILTDQMEDLERMSCLRSSRGSILINGSPTEEFQFFKGLKQGDPLSPFLFILVMESLHLSFQHVVDAGLFTGINLSSSLNLSHLFYADDAMILGVLVEESKVKNVAVKLGCLILKTPFLYLGTKVGGSMSQVLAWKVVVDK